MSLLQGIKVPIRTCLGCGKKAEKYGFLRFVVVNGLITVDSKFRATGRGAYCCRNEKCLDNLLKREKKLARSLHCERVQWQEDRTSLMSNLTKSIAVK